MPGSITIGSLGVCKADDSDIFSFFVQVSGSPMRGKSAAGAARLPGAVALSAPVGDEQAGLPVSGGGTATAGTPERELAAR